MPRERTDLIKVTPEGGVTLAHPGTVPGPLEGGGYIVAVEHVPMHMAAAEVVAAYRQVKDHYILKGVFRVNFNDL